MPWDNSTAEVNLRKSRDQTSQGPDVEDGHIRWAGLLYNIYGYMHAPAPQLDNGLALPRCCRRPFQHAGWSGAALSDVDVRERGEEWGVGMIAG